jgi:hypothetical protein
LKDLAFLMITLGLIMFAMMFAQKQYYSQEADVNQQWEKDRHLKPSTAWRMPTATPTVSPTVTPTP